MMANLNVHICFIKGTKVCKKLSVKKKVIITRGVEKIAIFAKSPRKWGIRGSEYRREYL